MLSGPTPSARCNPVWCSAISGSSKSSSLGLKKELPGEPKVIATGGMADIVSEWTKVIDIVSPRLTLEGLRIIYELNV